MSEQDKTPQAYHVIVKTIPVGQTFTGCSAKEYRVGRGGVVTPNPTDPEDLDYFKSKGQVFVGEPDLSAPTGDNAETLRAENIKLVKALDTLRGDVGRRDDEIKALRASLQDAEDRAARLQASLEAVSKKGGK